MATQTDTRNRALNTSKAEICTIKDIISFSNSDWRYSEDFFYYKDFDGIYYNDDLLRPRATYYSCTIVKKGQIVVEVGNEQVWINEHDFLIGRPDDPLYLFKISPDTTAKTILFSGQFADIFKYSFLHQEVNGHIKLSPKDSMRTDQLFTQLMTPLIVLSKSKWEVSARMLLAALLNELDLIVQRYIYQDNRHKRGGLLANQFKELVNRYYPQSRNLGFYAKKLNITTNYLIKLVKKELGSTPMDLINQMVTATARQLLLGSQLTVGQVGDALSFPDVQTFSKFIKRQTGYSPTLLKNSNIL